MKFTEVQLGDRFLRDTNDVLYEVIEKSVHVVHMLNIKKPDEKSYRKVYPNGWGTITSLYNFVGNYLDEDYEIY